MIGETGHSGPSFSTPFCSRIVYGCLFCVTGKEQYVAQNIERHVPQIHACAVYQTKRHSLHGKTFLQNELLLPGYVMFQAPEWTDVFNLIPEDDTISILTYSDGDWRLYGTDEEYAKWIFRYDGLISLSKAYKIGDRIQIVDGPLKDMEGLITRIDRRNQSGQVTLTLGGKQRKVWLGFKIIEELPSNEKISMAE